MRMRTRTLLVLLLIALITACTANNATQTPRPTETPVPSVTPESTLPPSERVDLSYKVAAFYYPWYGNPDTDGEWIHWKSHNHIPRTASPVLLPGAGRLFVE
jgi:hypothetical protein